MNTYTLVIRSLRYYWRTNLGILLGALLGTAILIGALVVGDSVRHSLTSIALSRLGTIEYALYSQDRFFREELATEISNDLKTTIAPVLALRGTAAMPDGTARANNVQILGVDSRFWELNSADSPLVVNKSDGVIFNDRLATQLNVKENDTIILRFKKPSDLPRDAPLSTYKDADIALRVDVQGKATDSNLGRFSLNANQIAPYNVFIPLEWLQKRMDLSGQINMLLVSNTPASNLTLQSASNTLRKHLKLEDTSLELHELPDREVFEIRTNRVFIEPILAEKILKAIPDAKEILTYFVNKLSSTNGSTPYSMVTGMEIFSQNMATHEVIINEWLAEDLQVSQGDKIQMEYFVLGPMRKLIKQDAEFKVREVVPIKGIFADPYLMPPFSGLSDAENCNDWDPGFPVDLDMIRPKDEAYWDEYRGTPKAFINLNQAKEIWGNRYGNLTAIRFPKNGISQETIEKKIIQEINPATIGLFFQPVRQQALTASNQSLDFGQLFLGFSFFLIIAALLLVALLFKFGIEQRAKEMGTLLVVGFHPYQVRRLLLYEGLILAILGTFAGTICAVFFTRAILYGLSTIWIEAVGTSFIQFHANPITLIIGMTTGILITILTIWLTSRKQATLPARELLSSDVEIELSRYSPTKGKPIISLWIGTMAILGALALIVLTGTMEGIEAAGGFFGAGFLLLIAGLSFAFVLLVLLSNYISKNLISIISLGIRSATRRRGRSLATIALLACGSFLVVAIGANRHDPTKHSELRSSGTGGFAFYGQSTLPVFHDLNTQQGWEVYGLSSDDLPGVKIVPFKVRDGDDASCLNLNRPQVPRLFGVNPKILADREAFTFKKTISKIKFPKPWLLLNEDIGDNLIPAIGDQATVVWALGKSVGDTLDYIDEKGRTFSVYIVGTLANTILQGSLLISEDNFVNRFPTEEGYRTFLFDTPQEQSAEVSKKLSATFKDIGMELTPAGHRLAEFSAVENTYLSIFQILGGLGLILGTVGLGIVVLRNVLERRGELALLRAVGFEKHKIHLLVIYEHWFLLLLGIACGVVSALIAVFPALLSPGAEVPYLSLCLTIITVLLNGLFWIWIATNIALRGPLLSALRNE